MVRKGLRAVLPLCALIAASNVYAQVEVVGAAPESIQSTDTFPRVYAITIDTSPYWERRREVTETPFRRAEPVTKAKDMFTADDPGFAELLADPKQPSLYTNLILSIAADGAVTDCADEPSLFDRPDLAAKICPTVVSKLDFLPALDAKRQPMADKVRFLIDSNHWPKFGAAQMPAIRNFEEHLNPAPAMIPNYREAKDWPPTQSYGLNNRRPFFRFPSKVENATAEPYSTDNHKIAGVVAFARDYQTAGCETVISSGDAKFDTRACKHVLKKAGVGFAGATFANRDGYPLLVVGRRKPERIVAPDEKLVRWVRVDREASAAFFNSSLPALIEAGGDPNRLRLHFTVGAAGKVRECRISNSSGTTAADILACDAAESSLTFNPAVDAFGQARDGVSVWWRVPKS